MPASGSAIDTRALSGIISIHDTTFRSPGYSDDSVELDSADALVYFDHNDLGVGDSGKDRMCNPYRADW